MPRLPSIDGVRPTPRPSGSAVGFDGSAVARSAVGLGQTLGQIGEDYQREQDAEAIFSARRQLDEWERDRVHGENGAINKKGRDAFGIGESLAKDYTDFSSKVAAGLSTQRQRQLFQEVAEGRKGQILDWAGKHERQEKENYSVGQYNADIASMQDRALLYPDKAAGEIAAMSARADGFLRSRGKSDEEISDTIRRNASAVHSNIIANLNESDPRQARQYFEANKGSMTDDQMRRAEKAVNDGVSRLVYADALSMVTDARRDNKSLSMVEKELKSDRFKELDPVRKAQLYGTIEGYKASNEQRAEAAARRAEAAQERALRKAEASFNAAQSLLGTGKMISPEFAAQVSKDTAGTPYAIGFQESLKGAAARSAFVLQPPEVRTKLLQDARAQLNKQGTDPATEKQIAELTKIDTQAKKDFATDPLPAALEYGVIQELAPLDVSNPQSLVAGLPARMAQAQAAQQQAGKPVSPFTAAEADQVGEMIQKLPPADRSQYVSTLAKAVGPQAAGALAQQIDKKDRALGLAFGMAGSQTSFGRNTSELVLKGAQAKKDGTSTKGEKEPDVKAARWKATAAADLSDVFPVQGMTDAYVDAAELIMHGIAAEQGGKLSKRDMERAVGLAIGGTLIEHNGRKTPLPAGLDEDALDKRLKSVKAEEIGSLEVIAGGVKVPTEQWVKTLPGAELIYAGPGRYSVIVNGRPVTRPDGKRVVIGVTQ